MGDQNDDGFADFGVLSWGVFTIPGRVNAPQFALYHGGNPVAALPYRRFAGDSATLRRMMDARPAGDVNGDGYADWTVQQFLPAEWPWPRVQLFLGGPNADTSAVAVWAIYRADMFSPMGDFNGDGFDDLYWYHASGDYGQAFFGGSVIDTLPDWERHGFTGPTFQQPLLWGKAGDLTGDGYSDFVSYLAGATVRTGFIFCGAAPPDTLPAYTWVGIPGYVLGTVNDLNGDGHAKLLISDYPQVNLYWGRDSLRPEPDVVLTFPCTGTDFHEAHSLGDINADGYGDLALVSTGCQNAAGMLSVYLGHPWLSPAPAATFVGQDPYFNGSGIWTAAGLGDVNGDGIADWGIGGYGTRAGYNRRGQVRIIAGDTDLVAGVEPSPPVVPQALEVAVYPNPFNSTTTIALETPRHIAEARLTVYNLLGQAVFHTTLPLQGSRLSYRYDAADLATGLYLLRVEAGSFATTQKLMLLK